MWKYYLDDSLIKKSISERIKFPHSETAATHFLTSIGYSQEKMRLISFENAIFTEGSMNEVYSKAEIHFCEEAGNIFISLGVDIFNFFLIDVDEEQQYDAEYIGTLIKLINKAHKGGNIIVLQCGKYFMFGSRYISKFVSRDFHFTYWISDIEILKRFASYNVCKKNQKYSYAVYMAYVCQLSLFSHKKWKEEKIDTDELQINFIELSKKLSYIMPNQVDSFELLENAIKASQFISTDAKLQGYREEVTYTDEDFELYDETDLLFKILKE